MPDKVLFAGEYVVQDEIAKGGMGVIYKALDQRLKRLVALKVFYSHFGPAFTERFLREARAMAWLNHDNIIKIYAAEEEQGTPYIVMEYFPGSPLSSLLRASNPLTLRTTLNIALQVADALAYAHAQKIVHGDIKPANVLIDSRGRVKVTDFGITAAFANALDESSTSDTAQIRGTPVYLSPEQAAGKQLDDRTDMYSLGIMLYEMLVGSTPFHNQSKAAILGHLIDPQYQIPLDFPMSVPSAVRNIVESIVRHHPHRRQTAQSLVAHLKSCLQALAPSLEGTEADSPLQEPSLANNPASGHEESIQQGSIPINVEENVPEADPGSPKIFFCYRREDSADVTGRIYDWLLNQFGQTSLFKDVDSIPYGVDFRMEIDKAISTSTVVLVIIGRKWLTTAGKQRKRDLDSSSDYVRIELASALKRQIPVIPVLVAGASMPSADALPDDIRDFSYRNAVRIKPDPDFRSDMDRLIKGILKLHESH
jgi:serine/threonine protein kinase